MDGRELLQLIENRWSTLHQLLEISSRQMDAIRGCRMSELMRLLSDKQTPLNQLLGITEQIRLAAGEDPVARRWESDSQRQRCRQQQEECERMHLELLAIDAECESALQQSRVTLQQRLDRVDSGRAAANGYASTDRPPTSGGSLDLSSS
jgi:hypothetical protein